MPQTASSPSEEGADSPNVIADGVAASPWRVWRRGMLLGTGTSAIVVLIAIAMLVRSTLKRLGEVSAGGAAFMWKYVLSVSIPVVGFYLLLGALSGVAAVWATRRRSSPRLLAAAWAIWGVFTAAAIPLSPASMMKVPVAKHVPFGVLFFAAILVTLVLAAWARMRWARFLVVAALIVVPLAIRPSGIHVPAAPRTARGSVLLLGLDDVGRGEFEKLAHSLYARESVTHSGFRLLIDAVSPVPVTRYAWRSILTASTPTELAGLDTLSPEGWQRYFRTTPFLLPRQARAAGYRTAYLSDDATTNSFLPGEAFDEVREDAVGWQVEAHYRLRLAFPLYAGYIGRWTGVGIPGTLGSDRSLRLYGAIADMLGSARQPMLVAAHAVALHGPLKPTVAELGGPLALLGLRPSDLEVLGIADPARSGSRIGMGRLSQVRIYEARRARAVADLRDFLEKLDRAGYRRNTLIILFSDHGELFLDSSAVGVHGTVLDPTGTQVAVLVLLPRQGGSEPLRVVRGTFPLAEMARLAQEFMARSSSGGERGGLLDSLERGLPLPRRMVAARSVGRPEFDGHLFGDRRTFKWSVLQDQIHFWPRGRISLSTQAIHAMFETADVGATDGNTLVACAPMRDGTDMLERYEGQTLIQALRVAADRGDAPDAPDVACRRRLVEAIRVAEKPPGSLAAADSVPPSDGSARSSN